ncbi:Gfo/Idh/MocA family protein [Lentibacillus salinarum]|uniref:Gfo/Idh/MocA family protein n=1 Tax=Lentibacillus salinarum TaxID=446820 RepID=A0ABW3ZVR5_9BACI
MEKINWGILSTAEIARKLTIPAILRANNAELNAIASLSGNTKDLASKHNIPKTYHSYGQLLSDPDIDAVYIPLPNHLHAEWVKKAAEMGKHVLCEKPAALTAAEANEMVTVCEQHGVVFMETFTYQYHPQNKRVKNIIATGEIGDVKLVRSHCSFYLDKKENFRLTPDTGGGSLYDVGCYSIHTIRNVLEQEPTHVWAKAVYDDNQVDMSATCHLEFGDGKKGTLECGMDMAKHMVYEVVGTKGVIQVPRAYQPDMFGGEGILYVLDNDGNTRSEMIQGDEFKINIEHFSDCVLNETKPFYDGNNTIRNMNVLEACITSAKSGKEVNVTNAVTV